MPCQIYPRQTIQACLRILTTLMASISAEIGTEHYNFAQTDEGMDIAFAREILQIQKSDDGKFLDHFPLVLEMQSPLRARIEHLVANARVWEPIVALNNPNFTGLGLGRYLTALPVFRDDSAVVDSQGRVVSEALPLEKREHALHPREDNLNQGEFDRLVIVAHWKRTYLERKASAEERTPEEGPGRQGDANGHSQLIDVASPSGKFRKPEQL